MSLEKTEFIERFSQKLLSGDARVFVGAGISSSAGYPTWSQLVETLADEIEFELSPKSDLTAVVQYYVNEYERNRLASVIREKIDKHHDIPGVLSQLAKLPLREIWTTNFDTLIERAWHAQKREIEAVYVNEQLTAHRMGARTILYKMHGTIEHAHDVVISRDDFETYENARKGFTSVLLGQYIEKTFLFLGLSFSDPNLTHLFSEIRRTFGGQPPEQFTILKRPSKGEGENAEVTLANDLREYKHWKKDLEKYGIRAVEVSDYDEIEEIIKSINSKIPKRPSVVSGFRNSRVLVIDNQDSSIIDNLTALNALTGGLEHRICPSLDKAYQRISDFEPNIVLINLRLLGVKRSLAWIKNIRTSAKLIERRIVFGVIQDEEWSSETEAEISTSDFGTRVSNHYSLKVVPDKNDMLKEVGYFVATAHIDFALQYLDESVTSILEDLDGRLSQDQVGKFANKAGASIKRLDGLRMRTDHS